MPRRRPSTLRRRAAARRPFWVASTKDGRLSGSTHAAILLAEHWPGEIFNALGNWEREARTSRPWGRYSYGCGVRECCGAPRDDRDILEETICRIPRRPAQELRRLVRSIDDRILAKFPARLDHFHRWWHVDFPWDGD
ncbi:hypothetical protein ACIGB8_10385 [Promicromonospora sukumoe]|uniref:hypothetical protein n=1 Tax=Promicromonospora sukumoe TaxID=88382 RepID=UPI0037C56D12